VQFGSQGTQESRVFGLNILHNALKNDKKQHFSKKKVPKMFF
jgi:hypothetical protein